MSVSDQVAAAVPAAILSIVDDDVQRRKRKFRDPKGSETGEKIPFQKLHTYVTDRFLIATVVGPESSRKKILFSP